MAKPTSKIEVFLDAWPILEWLNGSQPALAIVRSLIEAAFRNEISLMMCRIKRGEVLYSTKKDFPTDRVEAATRAFLEIPIQLHSVDDALIDDAVELRSVYPISYADAFAAALAMRLEISLVTGDRELFVLKGIGLQLQWVGV